MSPGVLVVIENYRVRSVINRNLRGICNLPFIIIYYLIISFLKKILLGPKVNAKIHSKTEGTTALSQVHNAASVSSPPFFLSLRFYNFIPHLPSFLPYLFTVSYVSIEEIQMNFDGG